MEDLVTSKAEMKGDTFDLIACVKPVLESESAGGQNSLIADAVKTPTDIQLVDKATIFSSPNFEKAQENKNYPIYSKNLLKFSSHL